MDSATAKIVKVIGVMIVILTALMVIFVVVMLATGAKFVPIMAVPVISFGVGLLGVLLSALLIISGNSGGWALLAIIACICLVGYFFPKEARASNPDAISRDGKPMESVAHFVFDDGGRAGWETWRALGLAGYGHRCGSYGSNAKPVDCRHNRGCAVGALGPRWK
ncbi:hypothetical protein AB0D35_06360 [Streptomyces sp. NPDC048301]|uniref:hypothetical protein n=1 Tax=Streptomyces sp. NPDC048301 TaxID=3155631 RepID=UPI003445B503